jgi:hypothetical protein
MNHGYDTLFRPYFSTYDPISYRYGLTHHFYNNPSYHLFGELDRYSGPTPVGRYTSDPSIDMLEIEMNNFLSNINNPHSAYNAYNRLYPYSLSLSSRYSAEERLAEMGLGTGSFEENRRTPYGLNPSNDPTIKPVDYDNKLFNDDSKPSNMQHLSRQDLQNNNNNNNQQGRNSIAVPNPQNAPQQRQSIVPNQPNQQKNNQQQQQQNNKAPLNGPAPPQKPAEKPKAPPKKK